MGGHGAPGDKGAKEEKVPDCYWLTVDRSLHLIQKMGGFLGTIAALTGTVCLILLAAWQLGLTRGQVTPNPATAPWWRSSHQSGTSVRPVTETAVTTVTSPSDPDDCVTGALHGQALDCHVVLLRDALSQLQAVERKVGRLERMLGDRYPQVKFRSYRTRKRILVTGGAGFVGSHLVDRLLLDGHEVTVVDNLQTGRRRNIETWLGHTNFQFVTHDVVMPFFAEVDEIYHLASPASPPHYMTNPVKTIKTNTLGTLNMLGLAKRVGARLLLASTSEVYGDPEVHPQPETYWGNVNPIGPRACYDEGKRLSETLAFAYQERSNVSIAIARIFNTYGPRMHNNDGRVVSNFILQALQNKPLTIYGSGEQTRSFQYVYDLVEGLVALMESNHTGPINIGNPDEHSITEFAELVQRTMGSTGGIRHLDAKEDDPQRRRPNISLAKELLGWKPSVPLVEGIRKTVEFFRGELQRKYHDQRNIYDPLIDWSHIGEECMKGDDEACQEA